MFGVLRLFLNALLGFLKFSTYPYLSLAYSTRSYASGKLSINEVNDNILFSQLDEGFSTGGSMKRRSSEGILFLYDFPYFKSNYNEPVRLIIVYKFYIYFSFSSI